MLPARQHTPKVAFVSKPENLHLPPAAKKSSEGDVDLLVRAMSMGKLHHAMMGTASVAIATAAAIPGTLVNLRPPAGGDREGGALRPSFRNLARRRRRAVGRWRVAGK